MEVYRIAKSLYIRDLTGTGARMFGGRWNRRGIGLLYTSESRALATAEFLVHMPFSTLPKNLNIASIVLPEDASFESIGINALPTDWRQHPAPERLAEIGTNWIQSGTSLALRVPSAVIVNDFNVLINPAHPEIVKVSIGSVEIYDFDTRLLRR